MIRNQDSFLNLLPISYNIKANLKATVMHKQDKLGNKKLCIMLNISQTRIFVYPPIIQRFVEEMCDEIDDDVIRILSTPNHAQLIMTYLIDYFKK